MKKKISVVRAVIYNEKDEILCTLCPPITSSLPQWEFPSGEVNEEEKPKEALIRVIKEKLNCTIAVEEKIKEEEYEHLNEIIYLITYKAIIISSEHKSSRDKGLRLRWVRISALKELRWEPGNFLIVNKIYFNQRTELYNYRWSLKTTMLLLIFFLLLSILATKCGSYVIEKIDYILISYAVSVVWSWWFHFNIFKKVVITHKPELKLTLCSKVILINFYRVFRGEKNNYINFNYKEKNVKHKVQPIQYKSFLFNLLKFLFSYDYYFASYFKELLKDKQFNDLCPLRDVYTAQYKCRHNYLNRLIDCQKKGKTISYGCERHQEKKRLKDFVIFSNWFNVLSAAILVMLTMFLYEVYSLLEIKKSTLNIFEIMMVFIVIRLISRAIEVTIAFYYDVVRVRMHPDLTIGERSTNLKKGNRISLAIHSYIEFVLLFSMLYYLNPNSINSVLVAKEYIEFSYLDFLLYSASVSAFNVSFDMQSLTVFGKVLHALQVFLSINLVVLSLAAYLGLTDGMNEYEKADWENGER